MVGGEYELALPERLAGSVKYNSSIVRENVSRTMTHFSFTDESTTTLSLMFLQQGISSVKLIASSLALKKNLSKSSVHRLYR